MNRNRTRNSFGATAPPFIDYLKDILRRYPDGGQILKELIQNADDAEASEVIFIHDERSYGTETLWTDDLGKYQGPALYAYNNAVFTAEDWEGIQNTGRSVKRDDPNKVGRFGIGFNSVYHITDVPCIFSAGHIGLLDPQEKLLGKEHGGIRWSLSDTEDQETLMTLRDQFHPLQDIIPLVSKQTWENIITGDQLFHGTLFRFPLRNEASEISDNVYDTNRVAQLFDSFLSDADLSPLFLRNVASVSLIHVKPDNSVNIKVQVTCSQGTDVVLESDDLAVQGSTSFKYISFSSEDRKETKKWLITSCCMKEGHMAKLDTLAKKLGFRPQVDLAFPCGQQRHVTDSRLSCFLPLPNNESNKTGLPVYVNACFGLTDNRRHIKWQEEDQRYDEAAQWNELLVKDVLPQVYLRILQDAVKLSEDEALPASVVYDLWPDISQMQHKDKWHDIALDVLQHLFRQNVAVLSLAADERKFVTLSEALLPCNHSTSTEIVAAIKRILVSYGENLVTLPDSVARAIKDAYQHHIPLRHVTPSFLRAVLHRNGLHHISKEDKLLLLEYILSDGQYRELQGLQLLPLSDGTFRSFTDKEEDIAFIDSNEFPRVLLPGCKNLFIPNDLSTPCLAHLKDLATKHLFKIVNINANDVAEYAKRYLPKDWLQTDAKHVTWEIGNSQHPPLGWLQEFWMFLNTHFRDLSCFIGMPLIPIKPRDDSQNAVLLARLQQNSSLVFQKTKQTSLPDQIVQIVKKVGGTVVKDDDWLKHEDLDTYVLNPSPRSVMQLFVNLDCQHVIKEIKTLSHREREALKDYLSSLDSLSVTDKNVLSTLALFQTMDGTYVSVHSKKAVCLSSSPKIPTDLPMPDTVVQCATEADRRLLRMLNIVLLDTAEATGLLIDGIERRNLGKDDIVKIMTWILKHGNILFSENDALKKRLKELNFIEMNGELKNTSSLFDPRIEEFGVLFGSDYFPPPVYTQTPHMLESLIDLGLLSKMTDVTPIHLLYAATQIDKLLPHFENEAIKRSEVLVKLLNTNDLLANFSKEQIECLTVLQWFPCVKPGDESKLNKDKGKGLFCPNEVRHSMYKDIVGHVMPLTGELNENVATKLGLKQVPPPEKVKENVSALRSLVQIMKTPDTDANFKMKLHSIYRHMQDNISAFKKVTMNDACWLWTHNQFVYPQDLVLDYPPSLDLSSYIGKIPEEFLPYKSLFSEFGLRPWLSDKEIMGILNDIKQSIDERTEKFASSSELNVSVAILNWMWREKKIVSDDIPMPVRAEGDRFTLKPMSTTVFCDISREGLESLNKDEEEFYVIHEEIPKATAEWLKVPLLSTRILSPEQVGIEQCGQHEPITTRIKNILHEYDEESDIFKELIQNAEDARAKDCKFMVDFRVHNAPPESLIDPGMSLCQGPCLWAFNNELFTEDDWGNIVKVGAASKANMVEKIGKFGLGFNTVYHVTDVPSILSGNHLLMLDPNVNHLKKHIKSKTNPGIKLDLSKQRLLHWFSGQFRPYECIFDCNFSKANTPTPYPGTLIKLPFRTLEEALTSEISKKVYDKQSIVNFQQHLASDSQTHLLFLKNVSTISLQTLADNAPTPPTEDHIKTIFTVSKKVLKKMPIPDETHTLKQHEAENKLKLDEKCKELIDCCTVSIAEITQNCDGSNVQAWLLYNCFGTEQSLQMALKDDQKAKLSLPVGGIAVPLYNDPKTKKWVTSQTDLVGQAFCSLPLSIHTGLPVNINGAFAVTSNRKGLWETGVKHQWNQALLKDPTATAYITVLLTLKSMAENGELESYCYHTFWPDREKVSDTFKPLVDAFYSAIIQYSSRPLELFNDGMHWCSIDKAIFLHQSMEEDKRIGRLAMKMCQRYVKAPNHVVPLPLWVRNGFRDAGLEKALQSRMWNWEKFYNEVVFSNLSTMDPESRNALVLHAIDINSEPIDNLLKCYPCIPTQSGQLQYIKKLVKPSGKVACLFDNNEGRLLGGTESDFCSPKRIQRLLELGMLNHQLPLEDILDRADNITSVWSKDKNKAYGHLKCILEVLRSANEEEDSPYWDLLRNTTFIPAFPPNSEKNQMVKLWKPVDVFSDQCRYLVNMTNPVIDHTHLNLHSADPVLRILGIHQSSDLRPETVLQQLQEACKETKSFNNSKSTLNKIAYECYKFLDQWLYNLEDSKLISETAHSFPFILVGDMFEHVKSVAENAEFEAKPYLHVLPAVFSGFTKLWECVGVEKKFTVDQCLTVLKTLHTLHGSNPLPKSDLNICLTINTGLHEAKEKSLSDCLMPDCLIPNEHGVLQPASKLYFNDSPWMPDTATVTLCHENIPRVMALYFGIKTTRHQTLQDHLVDSPFSFPFEQQEELTVRIKNIISAYPAKKDILKELIQNADDAEATEIHFVWDKRQHGTEKTFGEKWNQLQGPALCVYNNQVFSDADLKGIQQLGEGGKHDIQGKTGKYGLGFNSVYHLTDCPSIMTGDKLLCISDPNQKYIEGSSRKPSTGCGYKLEKGFKGKFDDVYKTFLPENFALEDGTMFRLPLRTGVMANNSKISNQGVTNQDMIELSKALSEDPEGLILFLKNIRKIQFHEINKHSQDLRTTFTVEKRLSEKSNEEICSFQKHLCAALQSDKPATPCKAIYDISISASDKMMSKWIIAEQFGSFKSSTGEERRHSDIIPQAALAACVHSEPVTMGDFNGGVFCSLPLPGKTGLPIHVNGNFEVDSSRRDLWKADGQSQKTIWNESLKQDVIAPLYADLIHYLRGSIANMKVCSMTDEYSSTALDSSYLCFFPTVSKDIAQDWHGMIQEVYRSINEKALDVIPLLRHSKRKIGYQSITEFTFDWSTVTKTELTYAPHLINPKSTNMSPILEDLGMKLVPFSIKMADIWHGFNTAGIELNSVTPSSVKIFLREKPMDNANQTNRGLPLPISHTLIRDGNRCSKLLNFCLKDVNEKNCTSIDGLPLLLTKDKVLRVFNCKSPKLMSRYDGLFSEYEADFAHYRINMGHQEILQHGGFLHNFTIPMSVKYVKPLLQRFLQDCAVDPSSNLHVPNEAIEKWLKELWSFFTSQIATSSLLDGGSEQQMTLSSVKELFYDCCILHVVCPRLNNRPFLQTMKDMPSVIPFGREEEISSILFKLGFTKLNLSFYTEVSKQVDSLFQPELMNPNDRHAVLDKVCKLNHSEFCHLSQVELTELQHFLQSGITTSKTKQDYQRKLTSLPLFETILGERMQLDNLGQVFLLNLTLIPVPGFSDLLPLHHSNTIFLEHSFVNVSLSKHLNIKILSDLEFFMKFILPILHKLTERQIINCVKLLLLVQPSYNNNEHEDKIISSLKDVKLIQSAHGKLEKASYYFDESVETYKMMMPQDKFVPESFWKEFDTIQQSQVKALLKALGMKHVVSKEEMIDFAHHIEQEAKGQFELKELKQKSSKLLETVRELMEPALTQESNDEKQKENQKLMERIADIKFIFPVAIRKKLCDYHPPFASERTAVAIRGSLIESGEERDTCLIWTAMPIMAVPGYWSKSKMQMLMHAGALEGPPGPCVTTNISNICQVPCQTNDLITTRAEVFRISYDYLQTKDFNSHSLTGLPVVLVENDKKLVKSEETSLSLHNDFAFRPYFYKIPGDDIMYAKFFKKIGVNEEPTAVQYCNVLGAIYTESCDKNTLNANQLITTEHAVKELFQLLKNQGNPSALKLPKVLHLPSRDGRLYPSNTLYFNDTVFQANRLERALENKIHLLKNLSLGSDMYERHRLLQLLPKDIQPKMLSQYTTEKVVASHMQTCEYGASCKFSGWFEKNLSSIHFRYGLICLIREQSREITQEDASNMCQQMFGSIQMVCCKSLETELWFDQQPLNDTKAETEVNVEKGTQGCIFYLKHSDIMDFKVMNEVNMTLTKEINALLDNKIPSVHLPVLGQLLVCDTLQEVQKTLAKNEIHDSAETQNLLLDPPAPGTAIPEEWHDSLDMNFINNFEEGEYVGFTDSASDEDYIYAVIVEKLPEPAGQLYSHRYNIQIGKDEVIEVSSLDLYQFVDEQASSTRPSPTTFEEAKKEIDECLAEIRTLSGEDRRKAIKRLYLRWHPNKNPKDDQLTTEAFKYLLNRIDELMTGKTSNSSHPRQNTNYRHSQRRQNTNDRDSHPRQNTNDRDSHPRWNTSDRDSHPRQNTNDRDSHPRQNTSDRDSHPRWNTNYRDFYEQWDQEAMRHRRGRERFNRDYHSFSYNFWTHHGNIPRPDREEAQRWCRQARCDLTAAHNDTSRGSIEWCLFKVHQAVEKALIAAEYKRTGQQVNNCSITQLAERISRYRAQFINLPQVVEELQLLGVDAKRTQYPSCHPPPLIPNGQFKPENETRALELASDILSQIETYVN